MNVTLLLGVVAGVLLLLALALLRLGWRQSRTEQVLERLAPALPELGVGRRWAGLERAFLRAGLALPKTHLGGMLAAWLLALLLAQLLGGWPLLLALLLLPVLVLRLGLAWRYRRRLRRMVQQLPQMLDQVVRSLQTGRTLGDAVVKAVENAPEPLRSGLARVPRNVQLGISLADALQDVADLYEQEELRILALGVRVNHRYGGSAIELLDNLIKVIHEREHIARQLRAMTGETRLTALVLAVLPVALAGYILMINPQYLLHMWLDEGGRQMLLAAFIMQLAGCLIMWRMLRSV